MRHRLTAAVLTAAALALTACTAADTESAKPKAAPPAYKVVQNDKSGNQRQVTVEVKTTTGLRAVFDDVTKTLKSDAGYFVWINCTTGGTSGADNRLANGKYAVGNIGAATTGLDEGEQEFEVVKDRKCPDKG